MTRAEEWDLWIEYLRATKDRHYIYRGVDVTWARKFQRFYEGKPDMIDVPMSRFKKSPAIATYLWDGDDLVKIYPCKSSKIEDQIDHFIKELEFAGSKAWDVRVNEDMSVLKNCLIQVANNLNLHTSVEIHGSLGQKHGFLPLEANSIRVWDERQKRKLIGWGLDGRRVIVDGYLGRYSKYLVLSSKQKEKIAKRVKDRFGVGNRMMVLVAPYTISDFGDGYKHLTNPTLQAIVDAIKSIKYLKSKVAFVVKLHPGCTSQEDIDFWKKQKFPVDVKIVHRNYDPYLLALGCDLMLAHNTTYAIDAMAMGIPVVAISDDGPSGYEEFSDVIEMIKPKQIENRIINGILNATWTVDGWK